MTINFPDIKEVIRIYDRKGAKRPLVETERVERTEDRVSISEEARRLAEKVAQGKIEKGEGSHEG